MKSGKLLVAVGAAFFLSGASSAQAARALHAKANSHGETVQASVKAPHGATVKSEGKGRGHKRPVQHDATLDYPQLG